MTAGEKGFLLLTSHLGDPERKPLTTAQFRTLSHRVRAATPQADLREMELRDLLALGYGREDASRILSLLDEEFRLTAYLRRAKSMDIFPLTRLSDRYPQALRSHLGTDAPGCIWYKGNVSLLEQPAIALVGSRQLTASGGEFARLAGQQAAIQGYVLISGNARGADQTAQDACLDAGGAVICVIADELNQHSPSENELFLCEDSFDFPFSALRALSRNRLIHSMGLLTLVAQCSLETGGTWDGTTKNLRHGWTPVFCHNDGSEASAQLELLGAELIDPDQLSDLSSLPRKNSLI